MSFTLQQERHIPEINADARLYVHEKSGARLLSIANNDENKVFGITFRTPPRTSNGIAHIMEHSVLCGSRKYPVKEPFIELAKGSLNTFLNAFTFPDKTCYPVASQNLQDFYNLIDVYLDAVFYPILAEHTLQQEGWHYELDDPSAEMTLKGVVFNEMKGAYSSLDDLLGDKSRASLFPDNAYGLDSGGDPLVIPDLTYDEFKTYHQTYYHPSNAYIYFYGDDPEDRRLRLLDAWLDAFDQKNVRSQIALQAAFQEPKKLTVPYDSGDAEDAKAHLTLNWLLPEGKDVEASLGLAVLSHILLATPASPLRKALTESGLGEDVIGGYEEQLRQTTFSAGLKGIQNDNLGKVEALILATLNKLAQEGIDPDTVAASLNTIEFALREKNTGRFPRGLAMMLDALTTWLYDGDPLAALAYEAPLTAVKAKAAQGGYFEQLIQKHLLDNPHRSTVSFVPDPSEGKRRENLEKERLAKVRAGMSRAELEATVETAKQLRVRQETPDSPEALATIPTLKLSDLDQSIKTIPNETIELAGVRTFTHNLFTNGIVYLDLGFDLHALPAELLPYAGLFGRLLTEMGTEEDDFVRLTQRIGRATGGIHAASLTSTLRDAQRAAAYLLLRAKATTGQASEMLAILRDVLLGARLDNRERFKQIVLEEKSGMEAGLIPGGHGIVNRRLRAHFTEADWAAEQMGGIAQLFFLRELAQAVDKDWASVLEKLERVRHLLINRTAAVANVSLDAASLASFSPQLASLLEILPASRLDSVEWQPYTDSKNEGLTIPAQVNYVGKGANLYRCGYQLNGSVLVINNYLGTTWLWEKIRVQGGAYGGFSAFDQHSGVYTFLSYRDPNLLASLDNYDATAGFLRNLDLSGEELTKSIIGTIGDMDAYQLPDAKGWLAMTRQLVGYNDEMRQQLRDEVLATTPKDFKAFGEALEALAKSGEIVVLGSAEAIEKANQQRAGLLDVKKVL